MSKIVRRQASFRGCQTRKKMKDPDYVASIVGYHQRSYTRNLVHSHPVFSKKCTFSMPISKARQEGLKKLFALADLGTPFNTLLCGVSQSRMVSV